MIMDEHKRTCRFLYKEMAWAKVMLTSSEVRMTLSFEAIKGYE